MVTAVPDTATTGRETGAARADRRSRQRRTCAKLIRFTPTEIEEVATRARVSGRPVACYIRDLSLGRRPKGTNAVLSNSVIRSLARVATRLRALTIAAKERDLPD